MLSEKLVEILHERRSKVLAGGGEDKIQERHNKGLLGARERLLTLFQPDTFQEIATHAKHAGKHFGLADKELPSDGVIVGTGFVDGRPVAAFSQDFTVMGGTLGKMHAKKIVQSMQMALKAIRKEPIDSYLTIVPTEMFLSSDPEKVKAWLEARPDGIP